VAGSPTSTLFAALKIATGQVTGACQRRHRHLDFLAFLEQVARAYPDVELHLVMDNYGARKHPAVKTWLAANPRMSCPSPRPTPAEALAEQGPAERGLFLGVPGATIGGGHAGQDLIDVLAAPGPSRLAADSAADRTTHTTVPSDGLTALAGGADLQAGRCSVFEVIVDDHRGNPARASIDAANEARYPVAQCTQISRWEAR
jgi:hypothetical protein